MPVQFVHAKKGHEFKLTTDGSQVGRIKSKFDGSESIQRYRTCVPKRWLTEGWVKEVRINGN